MKIIHLPYCFYPDAVGGTEAYVEQLCRGLDAHGVVSIIAAPASIPAKYKHEGRSVHRFRVVQEAKDLRELYGNGDLEAAQQFANILDEEQPDLVHMHAFTRGTSLRLIREAKRRGLNVVFTYHTPTVSCQRGTLMLWGREICDGVLDVHRCASCTLHGLGAKQTIARILGSLPPALCGLLGNCGLQGGAWTALRMSELVELQHSAFQALMQEVDRVVALCQWTKDLLVNNGVPVEKITLCRHGISQVSEVRGQVSEVSEECGEQMANGQSHNSDSEIRNPQFEIRNSQFPLKIAFLGRLDATKGPDVLIQAVRTLRNVSVQLDLYGIIQSDGGGAYLEQLKRLAENDSRVRFLSTVPSNGIVSLLKRYHFLAVPSRWLETGPLVVLEAFAAGIPVIGSDLGGIAELVQHETNGLLVETDSISAWSQTIRRCCDDRAFLEHLRRGVHSPRGMDAVADEMLSLYRQAVNLEQSDNEYANREIHASS